MAGSALCNKVGNGSSRLVIMFIYLTKIPRHIVVKPKVK